MKRRPISHAHVALIAAVVAALGLAVTLAAYRFVDDRSEDERQDALDDASAGVAARVRQQFESFELVLDSVAGYHAAVPEFDRPGFSRFVHQFVDRGDAFGVGIIRPVPAAQAAAFVASARLDGAPAFPDPTSSPPATAENEYWMIVYNEPASRQEATWGTDLAQDPARAAALAAARDQGTAQATEPLVLIVDQDDADPPASFVVFSPVYRTLDPPATLADRRRELVGWVNLPVRGSDFVAELGVDPSLALRIADARTGTAVGTDSLMPDGAQSTVSISGFGREWQVQVWPGPGYDAPATPGALPALIAGLIATAAMVVGTTALLTSRNRALHAVAAATTDLAASESRFRSIVDSAPDATIVVDETGRIVLANARADDLFGYSDGALLGMTVEQLLPESLRGVHVGHRRSFQASPEAREMGSGLELHALRSDGTEVPVEIALSPVEDEGRVQVIAAVRDRTEQRQARADQARLAAIVESSSDAIIGETLDGVIQSWNAAAERVFGYTAAEAVGRDVTFLLPDDRRHEPRAFLAQVALGSRVDGVETERLHRDGTRVPVALTLSPVRDGSGAIVGAATIVRDISQQVQARRALEAYTRELERSNEDLGAFAYVASHDLSEPLRVVGGYVDLLGSRYPAGSVLDESAERYIDTARAGVDRMRALIDDLLEYSRAGARTYRPEVVDLDAVLADARTALEVAITDAGAEVDVGPLPTVVGDRVQLAQLFQNLLSNALKFRHPERPIQISVTATHEPGTWRIVVADNGIGIPVEHHERIFAMFKRLHGRDQYEGTGIGLALCRRIAEAHGGWVDVTSEVGLGSRFVLSLPDSGVPSPNGGER